MVDSGELGPVPQVAAAVVAAAAAGVGPGLGVAPVGAQVVVEPMVVQLGLEDWQDWQEGKTCLINWFS